MPKPKNPPPFDVKQYFSSLKTEYNIPDDKLPKPELIDELASGYMRQSDYDSSYASLNRERERYATLEPFEKLIRTLEDDYGWGPREDWNPEQIAFARQNRGDVNLADRGQPAGLGETDVQRIVKKLLDDQAAQFNDHLQRTQRGMAMLIDFIPAARDDWRENFAGKHAEIPKAFPQSEFEKFISPGDPERGVQAGPGHGLPLETAWNQFKSPFDLKIREAGWEQKVKDAADEAYRRGRSEGPGSLEPFGDASMSAGAIADQQLGVPADKRPPQEPESVRRARFNETHDRVLRTGGVPAPAAPTAAKPT